MSANSQRPQSFAIHPSRILMFLLIVAVTMLFLAFSASYMYNRLTADFTVYKVPPLFYGTTAFILASSWFIHKAKLAFKSDAASDLMKSLIWTLICTLLFLAAQIIAWKIFFTQNNAFVGQNGKAYLYVLAATHFAHVIGGIPFLVRYLIQAYRKLKDPVNELMFFTDDSKRIRLNMLTVYWHFIDILWIYLIVFFLINYWI